MAPHSKRTYSLSSSSESLSAPSPIGSSDSAIDSCGGSPPPDHVSSSRKRKPIDKDSDQYKARRERNNEAVRKSRLKSKVKRDLMDKKFRDLMKEKTALELKVELLEKELQLIRSWVRLPKDEPAEMDGQGTGGLTFDGFTSDMDTSSPLAK